MVANSPSAASEIIHHPGLPYSSGAQQREIACVAHSVAQCAHVWRSVAHSVCYNVAPRGHWKLSYGRQLLVWQDGAGIFPSYVQPITFDPPLLQDVGCPDRGATKEPTGLTCASFD